MIKKSASVDSFHSATEIASAGYGDPAKPLTTFHHYNRIKNKIAKFIVSLGSLVAFLPSR